MTPCDLNNLRQLVDDRVAAFHRKKEYLLSGLVLSNLLKLQNPYMLRARKLWAAADLVRDLLDTHVSSLEESLFEDFLKELAITVASQACEGERSSIPGFDLELQIGNVNYLVLVKSGVNWNASSQQAKQEQDFKTAVTRLKQAQRTINVQPVLGICYGKTRTSFLRGYMKVVGQNFWYLISENKDLYTDIIEPIGYRAREHNDAFHDARVRIVNRFTMAFMKDYCDDDGVINWKQLVEFNSGNFDL